VITTLLLAGRSSDQAGRRPVLAVALGASALSTVVFILAPDVGALIAARIVSGLSAGLMTGTATAMLTELAPAAGRARASLMATAANMAAGVAAFAAFALLGLFSSLVPGFIADQLHQGNHAVQGAVVFLLLAVGAITQVALSRLSSSRVILAGLSLFLAALALIVAALAESEMALFLAGTVAGGVAVGAIFLGSLHTANRLAPANQRGQAISAFFVACYAGLIIPVVGVGVLSGFTGTFAAVLTFSILLAALSLFSIGRFARVDTVHGIR
jgi:MFS family permease